MKYKMYLLIFVFVFSCNKNESISNNQLKQTDKNLFVVDKNLSLKDYSSFDGYKPEEGLISNESTAVKIAEIVLIDIYGKEVIEKQKPFCINLENDTWLIEGQLEEGYLGGVAHIEINKNTGEIIKVLHTK